MEKRILLATVLCVLVFLFWSTLFRPSRGGGNGGQQVVQQQKDPGAGAAKEGTEERGPDGKASGKTPDDGGPAAGGEKKQENGETAPPVEQQFPEKRHNVRNEFLDVEFTSRGAGVCRVTLLDFWDTVEHKESKNPKHNLVLFDHTEHDNPPAGAFALEQDNVPDLEKLNWKVVKADTDARTFVYQYVYEGKTITKTFTLPEKKRHLELSVQVDGAPVSYTVAGPLGVDIEKLGASRGPGLECHLAFLGEDNNVHANSFAVPKEADERGRIIWGSVSNKYFGAILRACGEDGPFPDFIEAGRVEIEADPAKLPEAIARYAAEKQMRVEDLKPFERKEAVEKAPSVGRAVLVVAEGADDKVSHEYQLYFGPKDPDILNQYSKVNYDLIIKYGYFLAPDVLVKLFLSILKFLRHIVFDYGLAIIALTFLVKLLLHPLNRKNQKAMQGYQAKMAKIQPELDQIKERYKNNRRKMHAEMQNAMKEHGVNPQQMLGGCLLMFLQLPVWIALISVFRYSIELRQQPALFGLLSDLSLPDRMFPFGRPLPLVGWEHFNILPVLYVILTLINQKMMPKPKDDQARQQQKMMSFMMIFFGFIFYSFSCGLLLYFLTSSFLGIFEQRIIKHELKKEKEEEEEAVPSYTQNQQKKSGNGANRQAAAAAVRAKAATAKANRKKRKKDRQRNRKN